MKTCCKTVKQLKEIIKDWPESRADGSPTEVWLAEYSSHGLSNQCIEAWPLNKDDTGVADLILEPFETKTTQVILDKQAEIKLES